MGQDKAFNTKDIKKIKSINTTINKLLNNVAGSTLGMSLDREHERMELELDISKAVDNEYEQMSRYNSSKDFTSFVNNIMRKSDGVSIGSSGNLSDDLEKLIGSDPSGFGTYFQDRYRNINNQYEDLRILTEHVHELETAVTTLRDSIVCADQAGMNVTKIITFENIKEDRAAQLIDKVNELEKKYKLEDKLHDIIVPNTLTYGNYFYMTMPYNKIFSKFKNRNLNGVGTAVKESLYVAPSDKHKDAVDNSIDVSAIVEACNGDPNIGRISEKDIRNDFIRICERAEIITGDGDLPLLEDASISSLSDPNLLKMIAKKKSKGGNRNIRSSDGTIDTGAMDGTIDPEFADVTGVYTKLLSPLRTIPEYVLDECIGYYIVYEKYQDNNSSSLRSNLFTKNSVFLQPAASKETQSAIVDTLVTRIVQKMDSKFVKNNPKFRELIANALMYDDLYKKDFRIQFVSAEYITHFKINENIETHLGTSALRKSIFYGKMYMMYLLYTVINTVTRGSDMRVFNLRNSGIDKNPSKYTQLAARQCKENTINYNDLSSMQTVLNKTGKSKDIFINTGSSNEKPFDVDVIAGQDTPINTDFMEFLRNNMINGTDVPSVITEYVNTSDYAKGIEMGHIKYNSKVASTQRELEPATTEAYAKLLKFENPDVTEQELEALSVKYQRPKALNTQNGADIVSNAEQIATFVVKIVCGDSSEEESIKDELFRYVVKQMSLPGILDNIQAFEEALVKIKARAKLVKAEKDITSTGEQEQ